MNNLKNTFSFFTNLFTRDQPLCFEYLIHPTFLIRHYKQNKITKRDTNTVNKTIIKTLDGRRSLYWMHSLAEINKDGILV